MSNSEIKHSDHENLVNIHIQELISEIEQCREDERSSGEQLLAVLTTAGTVLGVLFGASYLSRTDIKNLPIYTGTSAYRWLQYVIDLCTNTRVFFWLTCFIFNAAFLYTLVIGIKNVLRFYHMRDLQDRLHDLIKQMPDNDGRGDFLRFSEFSAPILTLNIRHVSSAPTALHFFALTFSAIFTALFSIGIVFSQYAMIENIRIIDKIVFFSTLAFMFGTIFMFLRSMTNARQIAQYAWNIAHKNQTIRQKMLLESKENPEKDVEDTTYERARLFMYHFKYFLYPKLSDCYKVGLEIIGYLWCLFGMGKLRSGMSLSDCIYCVIRNAWPLVLCLVTFEFLAYQARYQINDIIGMREDREAGKKNKLIPPWIPLDNNRTQDERDIIQSVILSLKISGMRILLAVILSFVLCFKYKVCMPILLVLLFIFAAAYEAAKKKGCSFGVFVTVGFGYPLRFFVGVFAANPEFNEYFRQDVLLIAALLFCYGIFGSMLSWASEVVNRMNKSFLDSGKLPVSYEKQHFKYLQDVIEKRYKDLRAMDEEKAKLVLRGKSKLSDPWNIMMLVTIAITMLGQVLSINNEAVFIICMVADVALFASLISDNILFLGSNIISVLAFITALIVGVSEKSISYEGATIVLIEGMISVTYWLLRYQPQFKPLNMKEILKFILYFIFGEEICRNYIFVQHS